jgi:catechol 2,3-dioxygenase-like lactoylglutathione lyase family enzyme
VKRTILAVGVLVVWIAGAQFGGQQGNEVHFHHFHLNVVNRQASIDFYRRIFGAVPVRFGGRVDAAFTERSFILFTEVPSPAAAGLDTGIWHLGWGGVDGPREYDTLVAKGVAFQTPVTPLGRSHYMYAFGPDKEVLEIWTGYQNHRYGHVHLVAADPVATVRWYAETLGIGLRPQADGRPTTPDSIPAPGPASAGSSVLQNVDNVQIIVFRQPSSEPVPPLWAGNRPIDTLQPTRGRAVDHIAFSYRRIQPVYDRLSKMGVEITDSIAVRPEGFRSFFVRGPDNVTIEIVEAKPIPDSSWELP